MGRLSTHVLDTVSGKPAAGVAVELWRLEADGSRSRVTAAQTNADGRTDAPLFDESAFVTGTYELTFAIGAYFRAAGLGADTPFLDVVPIRFTMAEPDGRYHVPLVCTPWSYSTYRGS
jgi:5-hydroxyisourate hydrolase